MPVEGRLISAHCHFDAAVSQLAVGDRPAPDDRQAFGEASQPAFEGLRASESSRRPGNAASSHGVYGHVRVRHDQSFSR